METVVGVEGNGGVKLEKCVVDKNGVSLSPPKQLANPVLYKLVRVEGNGKLVPATDEEVMKVVDFLEVDESKMQIVTDSGQDIGCVPDDESSPIMAHADISGLPQCEIAEAGLEESSAHHEATVPPIKSKSVDIVINPAEECKNPINQPTESGASSPSAVTMMPDFSRLTGELSLDNLSIRDLQETFRATFGRQTTVKDKVWLKRRIAMGLTNSYDIQSTTFTIKDGKLLDKGKYEICMQANHVGKMEDHEIASNVNLMHTNLENYCGTENPEKEPQTSKRVRKPTKRYIEELSKVESKLMTASKSFIPGPRFKSCNKDAKNVASNSSAIRSLDYLGGSGFRVPCVLRARRSRPRKNINALVKFNPIGMSIETNSIRNVHTTSSLQAGGVTGHKVAQENLTSAKSQQICATKSVENKSCPVVDSGELGKHVESKDLNSCRSASEETAPTSGASEENRVTVPTSGASEENRETVHTSGASEGNRVTVPTARGGIRRKHHRPWTLSEVLRLVEGVSKYGAGRWSEIKRLAFASYSYRTSVDLKDKWRNLLKASSSLSSPVRVIQRKHASMSIPAAVLSRVRELAEMHAQTPSKLSSSKLAANN